MTCSPECMERNQNMSIVLKKKVQNTDLPLDSYNCDQMCFYKETGTIRSSWLIPYLRKV